MVRELMEHPVDVMTNEFKSRECCKLPGVHVPAHLVEDEPVSDGAVLGVVLHVAQVGVRLEEAADAGLHHLVPHPLRAHLRDGA